MIFVCLPWLPGPISESRYFIFFIIKIQLNYESYFNKGKVYYMRDPININQTEFVEKNRVNFAKSTYFILASFGLSVPVKHSRLIQWGVSLVPINAVLYIGE